MFGLSWCGRSPSESVFLNDFEMQIAILAVIMLMKFPDSFASTRQPAAIFEPNEKEVSGDLLHLCAESMPQLIDDNAAGNEDLGADLA
jgi:hypothetical protein